MFLANTEAWRQYGDGRYDILLMSLFPIYTGLIYNEVFLVAFELFGPSTYVCRDAS